MKKLKLCLIITGLLFSIVPAFAQTTGKIAGTVTDAENGEPLIGANVLVEGTYLGASVGEDGSFFILNVIPGTYTISVEMLGYQTIKIEKLEVSVNRTAYVNAKLNATVMEGDVIIVQADKIATKKDQTSSMKTVSSEQMEALPVENVSAVVSMQAGVVNGHFRGGRLNEVSYLVNGMPVDEAFGGTGRAVDLETDAVQDLEIITGTFNAEYGRAMSGIVNAVTKQGGEKFKASFAASEGSYYTSHGDVFLGLNKIDPLRNQDYKASISGALLPGKLYFFANTRYQNNKNYLNGIYRFNVGDFSDYTSSNPTQWYTEHTGDNSYTPMNNSINFSLLGNLTYKLTKSTRFTLLYTRNDDEWHNYSHVFKYDPYGVPVSYRTTDMYSLQINQMLSNNAFYQASISYFNNYNGYYVSKDIGDSISSNYVTDFLLRNNDPTGFYTGGQDKSHSMRTLEDYNAKLDLTWQVTPQHSLKIGGLLIQHVLDNTSGAVRNRFYDLYGDALNYDPYLPPDSSIYGDNYRVKPYEFAAYLQDKMEYEDMVINFGIRFDYFDPNSVYPTNRRNPDNSFAPQTNNRDSLSYYPKADVKTQISPRFGLNYKLGNKALLRFSYGHFFEMPPLYALFQDHSFQVSTTSYSTTMGNTQINAQKTVQYEIGLWQELSKGFTLDVALYYRDIYDLLSAIVITTYNQTRYGLYSNKDYGNTKGLEVKLDYSDNNWLAMVNYTLQYTRGNADNPTQTFDRAGNGTDPVNRLIVMSWDQRHTLNATVGYHKNNFGFTVTGYFNSGTPYTWTPVELNPLINVNLPPNNDYIKARVDVDLAAFYKMAVLNDIDLKFTLNVYNLLDRLNEAWVYSRTGSAYTDIVYESQVESQRSDFNDYYDRIKDPSAYQAPLYLKFGMELEF